jgi:hypothetical protein
MDRARYREIVARQPTKKITSLNWDRMIGQRQAEFYREQQAKSLPKKP